MKAKHARLICTLSRCDNKTKGQRCMASGGDMASARLSKTNCNPLRMAKEVFLAHKGPLYA